MSSDLEGNWSITITNNTTVLYSSTANINKSNLAWMLLVAR